jgi:hypothetical protein
MLKKAGIIAATATAGLLAVSPLAFATTDGHHGDDHGSHSRPVNVDQTNIEKGNLSNDCDFGQDGPEVRSTATGGSSLLGIAGLVTDVIAPVTAQTQLLNCNNINVSDLVDSNSNNDTRTDNRTSVGDSFNSTED